MRRVRRARDRPAPPRGRAAVGRRGRRGRLWLTRELAVSGVQGRGTRRHPFGWGPARAGELAVGMNADPWAGWLVGSRESHLDPDRALASAWGATLGRRRRAGRHGRPPDGPKRTVDDRGASGPAGRGAERTGLGASQVRLSCDARRRAVTNWLRFRISLRFRGPRRGFRLSLLAPPNGSGGQRCSRFNRSPDRAHRACGQARCLTA